MSQDRSAGRVVEIVRRYVGTLWFAVWLATVLGVAYVLVRASDGEATVWLGLGISIVGGAAFAWLSSVARRVQQERHAVRIDLRTWRSVPVWTALWFGCALVAGWALVDDALASSRHEPMSLVLGAGGVALAGLFARIAGRARRYLRVDVPAGVVEYVGPEGVIACSVEELGRFEITKHVPPYTGRRHRSVWHRLVAPGLPNIVLFESLDHARVMALQAAVQRRIDELADTSAVRRVLATTSTHDVAFRAAPDLAAAACKVVEDRERLGAALVALERDPDAEIGRTATAVRVALDGQAIRVRAS